MLPGDRRRQTVRRHVEHIIQLYEQQKTNKATYEEMAITSGHLCEALADLV